jgi:hypothetical protein
VPIEKNFNLYGTGVSLTFNSERWLRSLLSYMAIPQGEAAGKAAVRLSLMELEAGEVDYEIPLPHSLAPFFEGESLLGRPVPCRLFSTGSECWRDFAGFGRVWYDTGTGEGLAAFIPESDVDPLYADIMFGHNVLVELLGKEGFFVVHASCVQVAGKGILFTGSSGSGKSTAAFALMRRGHRLLADDRILLFKRREFYATSLCDTVKVRQHALTNFFPDLHSPVPFHEMDGECFFKAEAVSGRAHLDVSPLRHVMVFEKSGKPGTTLEKIKPSGVVSHLFPVTMNPGAPSQMVRKFGILMDMLGEVTCYRVHFGTDMERFCAAVEEATGA